MSVGYPVAPTAEAALHAPLGAAARESDARRMAEGEVAFVTELVGPAFASRAAALEAAARAGASGASQGGELPPWCALRAVTPEGRPLRPVAPAMKDGARWPAPDPGAAPARWRLAVTWWRSGPPPEGEPLAAARTLRRKGEAAGLDAAALRRLADQPLRAARTQRALDIGLFETPRPEAPGLLMPDE